MACTTSKLDRTTGFLRRLRLSAGEEDGQTMSEYAVILTTITLAIFLAIALLATNLGSHFTNIAKLVGP